MAVQLPDGYKPGLEGVVAGTTGICEIDPAIDALIYRGYAAYELAQQALYSEVAYLLLYGKLPTVAELEVFRDELTRERVLPPFALKVLKSLPKKTLPMTALQIGIACCQTYDPDVENYSVEANLAKAKRLIAKTPTIVAAISRLRDGKPPIAPDPKLSHAANFLYMVTGKEPEPVVAKAFDSTMILYAEHGYNASTFSALVTSSTLSDMHSAVVSAIGTLRGSLHGGANRGAIEVLLKIRDAKKVESWVAKALAKKEKIMGFGHRIYKNIDTRTPYMKVLAEETARRIGDTKIYPLAVKLEEAMKREKNIPPNVDYYAAVFYYLIGLKKEIYTPIFAMARMAGWTSHIIEQHAHNRLIRPECVYTGPRGLSFVPLIDRK